MDRSIARAEANDAEPSSGTRSKDAPSRNADQPLRLDCLPRQHRSSSRPGPRVADTPRSAPYPHHSTSNAGRSTPGQPGRSAGSAAVTSWMHRSRSVVLSRYSRAIAGEPAASYRSAACNCSFMMSSGSTRRNSPSKNSRNNEWYRYHSRRRSSGTRNRFDASRRRNRSWDPGSPRTASHSGAHSLVEHSRTPQEPLGSLGQARQRLVVEVVGHVAVVTGHRQGRPGLVPRDHRCQVQSHRPAFGPLRQGGRHLAGDTDVRAGKDVLPAAAASRAMSFAMNSSASPAGAHPRQVWLFGPARGRPAESPEGSRRSPHSARRGRQLTAARGGRPAGIRTGQDWT